MSFGGTLTNGIQDIAGLLPVIGTEKCEEHMGSALQRGYLYAAASPLSIFGSLGIIKAGVSILVASFSVRKPTRFFKSGRWLGARVLDNAGFKLSGTVAPLIGMDKKRYKAESRLIDMLEVKHIDNPENLSVKWKSGEWNLGLVVFTTLTAVFAFTPYIEPTILKPSLVHSPWMFPLLRILGSCITSVCCQILIQHRVISLMKNRIIFMVINQLHSDEIEKLFGQSESRDALPAEECLEQLEQHLRAVVPQQGTASVKHKADDAEKQLRRQEVPLTETARANTPFKTDPDPGEPPSNGVLPSLCNTLDEQRKKHFPPSPIGRLVFVVSWILLLLSLPATVAGYIGCFTVVGTSTDSKDPLTWLGIEAALSVIRILLWASDPKFDEETDVTVELTLTKHEPLVTTEKDTAAIKSDGSILPLMPERKFLEWVTPYTGPLEQFRTIENISLYFTLSGRLRDGQKRLFMTVFDLHKRMAFTLRQSHGHVEYVAASVTCDTISAEMQAELQLTITNDHPWQKNHSTLFGALSNYYLSLLRQLASPNTLDHWMALQWNLEEKRSNIQRLSTPLHASKVSLTEQDRLYLQRGHEHQRKSMLVDNWGRWIVDSMAAIRTETRNNCHYHLENPNSVEAGWELTEVDTQLVWEWTRREQNLLHLSAKLEDTLCSKINKCLESISERWDKQLGDWMSSEFVLGRRRRLQKEWNQAKARMEQASAGCIEQQDQDADDRNVDEKWKPAKAFINKEWEQAIAGGSSSLNNTSALEGLVSQYQPKLRRPRDNEEQRRLSFVNHLESKFSPWKVQRDIEQREMEDTITRVAQADDEQLESVYHYPESSTELATTIHSRFPYLGSLAQDERMFAVRHNCAGILYAIHYCNDADLIRAVVQKEPVRCVRLIPSSLINVIPENDNLLYLSTDSDGNRELVLPFIQRNRDRWWQQQTDNSFTFYFSPGYARTGQQYVAAYDGRIAHIMIHIETPTCLRLRLLHCRDKFDRASQFLLKHYQFMGEREGRNVYIVFGLMTFQSIHSLNYTISSWASSNQGSTSWMWWPCENQSWGPIYYETS